MTKPCKHPKGYKTKICSKCKQVIGDRENHLSMVPDEEWNPFEPLYDLLTKPHTWIHTHKKCPEVEVEE